MFDMSDTFDMPLADWVYWQKGALAYREGREQDSSGYVEGSELDDLFRAGWLFAKKIAIAQGVHMSTELNPEALEKAKDAFIAAALSGHAPGEPLRAAIATYISARSASLPAEVRECVERLEAQAKELRAEMDDEGADVMQDAARLLRESAAISGKEGE